MRSWSSRNPARRLVLAALALLAAGAASAADICPGIRSQQSAADPATRIAAIACNEHVIWYRPFIDRGGRIASSAVMEAETTVLGDGATPAWRRVANYWQESGLLWQMSGYPGAGECARAPGSYPSPSCRGFVIDNPWSAAFVSWVLAKAAVPGFRASGSHADYVRSALLDPASNAFDFMDPASAVPAAGDLLCYVRVPGQAYGHAGLRTLLSSDGSGLPMHCDIVVAANPGGDGLAYLVGGNVQQGVTMRMLPVNRAGAFWGLPRRLAGEVPCTPDNESACNFNRQDWGVLLKLKRPALLATLPRLAQWTPATLLPAQSPVPRACCVNCVVGSGVPRCPRDGAP